MHVPKRFTHTKATSYLNQVVYFSYQRFLDPNHIRRMKHIDLCNDEAEICVVPKKSLSGFKNEGIGERRKMKTEKKLGMNRLSIFMDCCIGEYVY